MPLATGSRSCSVIPVRLSFDQALDRLALRAGMSVKISIDTGHHARSVNCGANHRDLRGLTWRRGRRERGHQPGNDHRNRDVATLMQALDITIANVALPYMQGSLSATSDQINWVLTSYIVASAIITPATGWLEARFGRKPLFLTAVIGFVVTSMLCGAAVSLGKIVVFRLLQGIFGAPLVPLSQSVLLDAYPRAAGPGDGGVRAWRDCSEPILGPTLGGWLTDSYNWRWVFYVNVLSARYALSRPAVPRKARREALGWTARLASASRHSDSALGALQLFLDRGGGSTGSPRARSRSRPHFACSASTSSWSTPCRRATRSSIPRYSAIGFRDRYHPDFCRPASCCWPHWRC